MLTFFSTLLHCETICLGPIINVRKDSMQGFVFYNVIPRPHPRDRPLFTVITQRYFFLNLNAKKVSKKLK